MARAIRGVIYDCDGLIIDTEVPAFEAWREVFQEHGLDLPLEQWARSIGGSPDAFDPVLYLERLVGRPLERDAIRARRRERQLEMLVEEEAFPGILESIADAKRLGLRLAVASSSHRDWVTLHLKRLGILDAFDTVVTADDVTEVKPDPALYLLALQCLDLQPDEAIVLEDSPNGITAAQAAGIFCVAVPNSLTRHLPIGHADLEIQSLAKTPLPHLIEQVETLRQV